MIYLSCIVVSIHPGIRCDGTCGEFCDGMCDRHKDDVVVREWRIYSDAIVISTVNGSEGLAYVLGKPWIQRLV